MWKKHVRHGAHLGAGDAVPAPARRSLRRLRLRLRRSGMAARDVPTGHRGDGNRHRQGARKRAGLVAETGERKRPCCPLLVAMTTDLATR